VNAPARIGGDDRPRPGGRIHHVIVRPPGRMSSVPARSRARYGAYRYVRSRFRPVVSWRIPSLSRSPMLFVAVGLVVSSVERHSVPSWTRFTRPTRTEAAPFSTTRPSEPASYDARPVAGLVVPALALLEGLGAQEPWSLRQASTSSGAPERPMRHAGLR